MIHFGGFVFRLPKLPQKFGFSRKENPQFPPQNVSSKFRNTIKLIPFDFGEADVWSASIFVKPASK